MFKIIQQKLKAQTFICFFQHFLFKTKGKARFSRPVFFGMFHERKKLICMSQISVIINPNSKDRFFLHKLFWTRMMITTIIFPMTRYQTTSLWGTMSAVAFAVNLLSLHRGIVGLPPRAVRVHAKIIIDLRIKSASIAKATNQILAFPKTKLPWVSSVKVINFEQNQG